nr:MAG TPA: hypothetical protein [Caudoviricetes sp.]
MRAAQPLIAPLKAVVSGVANAPDGAFFPPSMQVFSRQMC